MSEMMDYTALAQLLFPEVDSTPESYEDQYPARQLPEGGKVTRYAPSPTGQMHIGNLFSASVSERCAHTSGGVFFLRLEDTDKKREIEGGIAGILRDLKSFGIEPDEGMVAPDQEKGSYGPYQQSKRKEIYHCYAKKLVEEGLAYPCFCSEEQLSALRGKQEEAKQTPGYYGEWAACRSLTLDQIKSFLQEGKPYVLRLRSPGTMEGKVSFVDLVKGKIEMPENTQDIVLLKTDGIPTYHFAHAVDDHLMRTTHVVRGDEWISSVPIHLQLFRVLGWKPPKYAHIAPLMKEEEGGKRKLSKRKDPEAAVAYYAQQGYPAASVMEYLDTLANSNFEEWRRANPDQDRRSFPFQLKKMSQSGALFDLQKLQDVSKNVISRMSAREVYDQALAWAKEYDSELFSRLSGQPEYAVAILSVDRGGKKPRKDLSRWNELKDTISYYYEEPASYELPEQMDLKEAARILAAYAQIYCPGDDKDTWFGRMKELCGPLGYSPDVKAYKKQPDQFKGHVGDVSAVVRAAITGRRNTPDLFAIMNLLGEDRVRERLSRAQKIFEGDA